jgi:hypothetical protein
MAVETYGWCSHGRAQRLTACQQQFFYLGDVAAEGECPGALHPIVLSSTANSLK